MRHTMILAVAMLIAVPISAARGPSPLPPSTVIFSGGFNFRTSTDEYSARVNVPQDGAWFYGNASYPGSGGFMDCDHHYEVDLNPTTLSPDYNPFLTVGFVSGIDTPCVFTNECFSCTVNFGGFKPKTDYTTNNAPGWLPAGSGTAVLHTLNGGSTGTVPGDTVNFNLAQVNAAAMQSMSVLEAQTNDFPAQASADEINSRAYIAASDDRVPLVPQFAYGTDTYPAAPSATFTATWDTGQDATVDPRNPYGHPGNLILLISIPTMRTGNHKVTVTAKLPSGLTFTAPAYQVFVYNVALEAVIGGSVAPTPVTFTRADTVTFRLQQQDTRGKVFRVTKADWTFLSASDLFRVSSSGEAGFPADSREWTGTMHASGVVSVVVTIQTGRNARTSHAAVALGVGGKARTDATWQTTRNLCENCWDDLGIVNGGNLIAGVVSPTHQNVLDVGYFPNPFGGPGLTLGLTGERHVYEDGLIDSSGTVLLERRRAPRPFPLYRPFDSANDPGEWPNRYSITQIISGPNRGFWYVTQQNYHTDWAYAVSAYFYPGSASGSNPANYFTLVPSCPGNPATESCYPPSLLSCWTSAHAGQSYFQAASNTINPFTGIPYRMSLLVTQVQTHEKDRHWTQFLVDYINANKTKYDIGTIMELIDSHDATEALVRDAIDTFVVAVDKKYAFDPNGGAGEVLTDPKTDFPLIEDLPIGSASCTLFHP